MNCKKILLSLAVVFLLIAGAISLSINKRPFVESGITSFETKPSSPFAAKYTEKIVIKDDTDIVKTDKTEVPSSASSRFSNNLLTDQVDEEIAMIDREIEEERWVDRANKNELSAQERAQFVSLLSDRSQLFKMKIKNYLNQTRI